MTNPPPRLSDPTPASDAGVLTITEDLSLMRVFKLRAQQGEPGAIEAAFCTLGRRAHRLIRETVFGFRVPG